MSKGWCLVGFGGLALISIINLALWVNDHNTSFDTTLALTPTPGIQNNLYPNGKFANVGTRAAAPSRRYPKLAEQGGSSSITNSTGRWAA